VAASRAPLLLIRVRRGSSRLCPGGGIATSTHTTLPPPEGKKSHASASIGTQYSAPSPSPPSPHPVPACLLEPRWPLVLVPGGNHQAFSYQLETQLHQPQPNMTQSPVAGFGNYWADGNAHQLKCQQLNNIRDLP